MKPIPILMIHFNNYYYHAANILRGCDDVRTLPGPQGLIFFEALYLWPLYIELARKGRKWGGEGRERERERGKQFGEKQI